MGTARTLLSVAATLTLGAVAVPGSAVAAPPANDAFASAQALGSAFPVTVNGTTVEATREPGEPFQHGSGGSVWYTWTAPKSGEVTVDTCEAAQPPFLAVYVGGSVASLSQPDYTADRCANNSDRLRLQAQAGTTYRIAVGDQGGPPLGSPGAFRLHIWDPRPANDDFADAKSLGSSLPVTVTGTTVEASTEQGEDGYNTTGTAEGSVWYRWIAPRSVTVEIEICKSPQYSDLVVFTGSALASLHPVDSGSGVSCAFDSRQFEARKGTTYRIAVAGGANRGEFKLHLREYRFDGSISQSASRSRIHKGGAVTYTVKVRNLGTDPIDPWVNLVTSKPGRLAQPVVGTRYVSLGTTRGSCRRVTFFVEHPGAICKLKLPPGATATITARIRPSQSFSHWAELDYLHGGEGDNSDDNPRNDRLRDLITVVQG